MFRNKQFRIETNINEVPCVSQYSKNINSVDSVHHLIEEMVKNSDIDFKNSRPSNRSITYVLNSIEQSTLSSKSINVKKTTVIVESINKYLDSMNSPIKYIFMLFILPITIFGDKYIFKTIAKFYVFNIYDFSIHLLQRELKSNTYHINTFEINKNIFTELENYNIDGKYTNKQIISEMKSRAHHDMYNDDIAMPLQKNNKRNIDLTNSEENNKKNKNVSKYDEKNNSGNKLLDNTENAPIHISSQNIQINSTAVLTNTIITEPIEIISKDIINLKKNNDSSIVIIPDTDTSTEILKNTLIDNVEIEKKEQVFILNCIITLLDDTIQSGFRIHNSDNTNKFVIRINDHHIQKTFFREVEPKNIKYSLDIYKPEVLQFPPATVLSIYKGSPYIVYMYIDIHNEFGHLEINNIQSHGYLEINMKVIDYVFI